MRLPGGVPRGELEEEARRKFAIDRRGCRTVWETRRKGSADPGPDARSFLGFDPHDEEAREALGPSPGTFMYP